MYVCICQNITTSKLTQMINDGQTVKDICQNCSCYKCVKDIREVGEKITKDEDCDGL